MSEFSPDKLDVLSRARAAGVTEFVVIGYDLASSRDAVAFAQEVPGVSACVAIHPHHADQAGPETLAALRELAKDPTVVAVGEIGLDFFRNRSPKAAQESAFRAQLGLANSIGLPVVVHDRDAHAETMRTLAEATGIPGVILHCFSGDRAMADEAWGRGYYTGIGGPLTYPSAKDLRETFRTAPQDRVLLETDAPYLPPTPHRGRRNEPAYLPLIAERLATLWNLDMDRVAQLTTANTRRAFARKDAR